MVPLKDGISTVPPQAPPAGLQIGTVRVAGRVFNAPMTGISDLPARRAMARLGASYVATEMVACRDFARGRPDVVRRAAVGEGLSLMVIQLIGCDAEFVGKGAALAAAAGAQIIDINMGCPVKEVTGRLSGSALMRDLDHAQRLIEAAVKATRVPVTVKMRLGWDDACRNAPELARRAEACGVQAITVHGRTRQQFYSGQADWRAVAEVKAATRLPVIVNGDIVDVETARTALAQSGADALMVARGGYGRPWLAAALDAALRGDAFVEPSVEARTEIVLAHLTETLRFYGDDLGLLNFRKHLAWYIRRAPVPGTDAARRIAKTHLCQLDDPRRVEAALRALWSAPLAAAA